MKTSPGVKSETIIQLMREHEHIKQVLAVLRAVSKRVERRADVPYTDLRLLVRFFQEYADKIHHYGEEELVFPIVEKSSQRDIRQMAGKLGGQHVMGRLLVSGLADAVRAGRANRRGWRQQFCGDAQALFTLLTIHICDEDNLFFPLADRVMSRRKATAPQNAEIAVRRSQWESRVRRLSAKYGTSAIQQCGCGERVGN